MKENARALCILLAMLIALGISGCGNSSSTKDSTTASNGASSAVATTASATDDAKGPFKIWVFDIDAVTQNAVDMLKAKHPNLDVQIEKKSSAQSQQSFLMVLNSGETPDAMRTNKGNGTAGLYAKQGLLTELDSEAEARGWTEFMSPSIQNTCRYDENGIMGSGKLWGVTNYGEYVLAYYNKDLFSKYNLQVPTTLEEFEKVCETFKSNGVTPLVSGGGDKWPVTHLWYELALYKADRDFVTNYQLLKGSIDFANGPFKFASQKIAEYSKKGYLGANENGISYADAEGAFIQGKYPIIVTGTWAFNDFKTKITNFKMGLFLMPGKNLYTGSGGDLYVVPKSAKEKELAYEYLTYLFDKNGQTAGAKSGLLPLNADPSQITDELDSSLITLFNEVQTKDGIAYYPDWPTPDMINVIGAGCQDLLSQKTTDTKFVEDIAKTYNDYKDSQN